MRGSKKQGKEKRTKEPPQSHSVGSFISDGSVKNKFSISCHIIKTIAIRVYFAIVFV